MKHLKKMSMKTLFNSNFHYFQFWRIFQASSFTQLNAFTMKNVVALFGIFNDIFKVTNIFKKSHSNTQSQL